MITGIACGFAAAFLQSVAYLCSRGFSARYPRSAITLLTLSHIVMGAFSLPLLGLIWPARWPSFSSYAFPLFGGTLFYLLAQAALFLALRTATASRTSPLLGLKIFILAIISVLAFGHHLAACQWLAVVMSVTAAAMLNWSGGSMPWRSIVWVLLACVGYSLSDLNVKALVGQFDYLGLTYASTVSVCLCYLLCALLGIVVWRFLLADCTRSMWMYSLPFAFSWFLAMLALFACFGAIGVIFGNIVQSSRGVMSILLGSCIARIGYLHLEEQITHSVFRRRILAAGLMMGAIALFYLSG